MTFALPINHGGIAVTDVPDKPADGRQRKPFAAWLQEQRNGSLHAELSEALGEVVAACGEHGKAGSVTLKLSVKPNKDGATFLVTDTVVMKKPDGDRPAALFFADDEGNLSRNPPRQTELPLREVAGASTNDSPDLRKAQ